MVYRLHFKNYSKELFMKFNLKEAVGRALDMR